MLDTIRMGCRCEVGLDALAARGWNTTVRTQAGGEWDAYADLATAEGVRLAYLAGVSWLSAEVSLPGLLLGDNALLLDWPGCVQGFGRVQAAASEAVGASLPVATDWRASRLDAVWAWHAEPSLYVAALRWARLPRCEPRSYGGSVSWMTMQGGHTRGRAYDKRAEAGRDVELPFRLERQTRRREVVKVHGERLPAVVGELQPGHVLGLVADTMQAVGLDGPIPGPLEARRRLVEVHGARRGRNLYRVLREVVDDFGGCWPSDVPATTRRRYQAQLAAAGIRSLAWQGELPGLALPDGANLR